MLCNKEFLKGFLIDFNDIMLYNYVIYKEKYFWEVILFRFICILLGND